MSYPYADFVGEDKISSQVAALSDVAGQLLPHTYHFMLDLPILFPRISSNCT